MNNKKQIEYLKKLLAFNNDKYSTYMSIITMFIFNSCNKKTVDKFLDNLKYVSNDYDILVKKIKITNDYDILFNVNKVVH